LAKIDPALTDLAQKSNESDSISQHAEGGTKSNKNLIRTLALQLNINQNWRNHEQGP